MKKALLLGLVTLLCPALAWGAPGDRPDIPTRSVEAMGAAPIAGGDKVSARQAAVQNALRAAVEQTTGVYVNTTLRTRNFLVLDDRVTTRAAGYAYLDEVLNERIDGDTYTVTIRATVSLGALAGRIAAAAPLRPLRVAAILPTASLSLYGCPITEDATTEEEALRVLATADFAPADWRGAERLTTPETSRVVHGTPADVAAWGKRHDVDVVITGSVAVQLDRVMPITSDWLKFDYVSCRASVAMRAVRVDSGEVLYAETVAGTEEGTSRQGAIHSLLARLGRRIGYRIVDALAGLPGARCATIRLNVSGFTNAATALQFQNVLARSPWVRHVAARGYTLGTLALDVSVPAEHVDLLATLLEEPGTMAGFRVRVASAGQGHIVASLADDL